MEEDTHTQIKGVGRDNTRSQGVKGTTVRKDPNQSHNGNPQFTMVAGHNALW